MRRWNVLERDGGDSCTTMNVLKATNCTLKTDHDGKFHVHFTAVFKSSEPGGSGGVGQMEEGFSRCTALSVAWKVPSSDSTVGSRRHMRTFS